ncbi:DGQHR domain-containing protein [Pseudomonas rhodesiae]|uniref:DGQHR domain-containing protein n=1 Tax=Pseudomonas rhodesiae TaxID=76760 RepID=UPI001BCA6823|nr:DGQHR domain-containing protein [Pseudomonas rhodesiae]QVN00481.1 DGQHR domain-containing protein [Pseudomonas rhodesiae]
MDRLIKGYIDSILDLKKAAIENRKEFIEISVPLADASEHQSNGYELFKELKRTAKLRRPINTKERLDRKIWILLYLLGYPVLKSTSDLLICTDAKEAAYEKIDVFAKDDETVIIGKCVSQEEMGKYQLSKEIQDFSKLKGGISKSVKSHFGSAFKPKIIWIFFSQNIIWSKEDKSLARNENINIITERELRYYLQISEHLRSAARYQFLAEFLKDQKIPAMQNRKVPALKGVLGGRKFYAFVSHPKELLKISFVNHRSLNDPEGAPSYQRLVSKSRLKKISDFISFGGFFPTNILVNFVNTVRFEQISKDEETGVCWGNLFLPDKYRSAWIIDGQHRLYGFAPVEVKHQSQNIVVIAFEKLPKNEEANLFVTINHEQKSVPKNLLDDLEGELKWESTKPLERIGAISARLISILNSDISEPLYGKVTMQGMKSNDTTCLTVPALKQALSKSGLIGKSALKNKVYELGPLCDANDTATVERGREIINHFFSTIRDANFNIWNAGRLGYVSTNTGIQAYLHLLSALIEHIEISRNLDAKELSTEDLILEIDDFTHPILDFLKSQNIQKMENLFKVQFGSGGPREYFFRLCKILKEKIPNFSPTGMNEWEEESSEDRISNADRKLKEINIVVQLSLFNRLKEEFGNDYWEKGVSDKDMKSKAYRKSLDDEPSPLALENYLDFIEYKKIVEKKEVWPLFKPVFNIPEPGEKETARNLSWMDKINELRRIPAHATALRTYKIEDFDYIDYVHTQLENRAPQSVWDEV